MSLPAALRRVLPVAVVVLCVAGAMTPAHAKPAAKAATRTAATAAAKAAPTAGPARVLGVAVPGAARDLSALDAFTADVGRAPGQVTWYQAWSQGGDFPAAEARNIAAHQAVPELVWEPWDPSLGIVQPAYSLAAIAAGAHDAYLVRWARQIKQYNGPLVIRLAHEMNGSWYPWAEGVNGNAPGSFVAAWRHVVSVFNGQKVRNVSWLWAPNAPYAGTVPLRGLYPGDAFVQRVGLDGYNWGTSQPGSSWQEFGSVFGPGVAELRQLTRLPIYVGETASTEIGGDKAAWIRGMWTWLAEHPEVRGVTWFDFDKETDWRVTSSPAALDAFRAGLTGFLAG